MTSKKLLLVVVRDCCDSSSDTSVASGSSKTSCNFLVINLDSFKGLGLCLALDFLEPDMLNQNNKKLFG